MLCFNLPQTELLMHRVGLINSNRFKKVLRFNFCAIKFSGNPHAPQIKKVILSELSCIFERKSLLQKRSFEWYRAHEQSSLKIIKIYYPA